MTTTAELDLELDAIDWDAPTGFPSQQHYEQCNTSSADRDPELYNFVSTAAELIEDHGDWQRFTKAFDQYERSRGRR
jgi:hypothetical protein